LKRLRGRSLSFVGDALGAAGLRLQHRTARLGGVPLRMKAQVTCVRLRGFCVACQANAPAECRCSRGAEASPQPAAVCRCHEASAAGGVRAAATDGLTVLIGNLPRGR
jgi:hypothetical protein